MKKTLFLLGIAMLAFCGTSFAQSEDEKELDKDADAKAEERLQKRLDEIAVELSLDAAQKAQLKGLAQELKTGKGSTDEQPDVDEKGEALEKKVDAILKADQKNKMKAYKEKKAAEKESRPKEQNNKEE